MSLKINFSAAVTLLFIVGDILAQPFTSPAPVVKITRDDHVATVEMDYNPFAGWGGQLWSVGTDGTEPIGYRVQWWVVNHEDMHGDMNCTPAGGHDTGGMGHHDHPFQVVTANFITQIQPIANDVMYGLRVEKLNGLGQICSPATEMTFMGGSSGRVDSLRASMTFFDDFNLPMGPADERLWNNAMGPQTDPRFNLFFINPQCHTHSLNGTTNDGAGDKSQTAQRARKPILIEEDTKRRIVFDMDGIFSPRSVWYLDLNPVKTDLTGHLSFFDFNGDTGLPADVLRLKASGHELSVNLINSAGASYKFASVDLTEFGVGMCTNVRRAFDVRVSAEGIQIFVDGISVLDEEFMEGDFKPGVYYLLWSAVGYNTSKDDVPYFLSHWDNFGFDGPDLDQTVTHNYVTRINGTDLQKSTHYENTYPTFTINVPDDIRPVVPGVANEVWLVFTYLKNDYSSFNIEPGDYFTFNGQSFPLPEGANNSNPLVPGLVDYSGSSISNRIKIGEVQQGGTSPLIIGDNVMQFSASNTGIMNVHLEVVCPDDAPLPPYTPPSEIHPFVMHHDLPQFGPPAAVIFIDDEVLSRDESYELIGPTVTGTVPIEVLAGNRNWANWGPNLLNYPATCAELWANGSTPGIEKIELFLRPYGDTIAPEVIATLNTSEHAPAPQVRYVFDIDTRKFANGEYELSMVATNANGVKSHPDYSGFAYMWDATEISGAYYPIKITVQNQVFASYIFNGLNGMEWTQNGSWDHGSMPPNGFTGQITIDADCEVPPNFNFKMGTGGQLLINPSKTLVVK